MQNSDFTKLVLKRKKDKVLKTVIITCDYCNLSLPTINFDGCSSEGVNGPELAHYHPDEKKICISEQQLKIQDENTLEDTIVHEVIHHFGFIHGSIEEKVKFEQIKSYIKTRIWRPSSAISYISGRYGHVIQKLGKSKKVKKRKTKDKSRDLESHRRILQHRLEKASNNEERIIILNQIDALDSENNELSLQSKITLENAVPPKSVNDDKIPDEEWEKIINNVYKDMDTGFGDSRGENRWTNLQKEDKNKDATPSDSHTEDELPPSVIDKKKGFWAKVKERLGILD